MIAVKKNGKKKLFFATKQFLFETDFLLLEDFKELMTRLRIAIWTNSAVPPNDGGISLGQAALAAFGQLDSIQTAGEKAAESNHA